MGILPAPSRLPSDVIADREPIYSCGTAQVSHLFPFYDALLKITLHARQLITFFKEL